MQRHFDEELKLLNQEILRMGSLVEEAIGKAMKALVERDAKLAQAVTQGDDPINMLEIAIDERCMELLARHQPAGTDLRFLTMALKINSDLERMGDLAVNIGERTLELLKEPLLKPLIDIPRMAQFAQQMVKDSLDAFVRRDAALARNVCTRDDDVASVLGAAYADAPFVRLTGQRLPEIKHVAHTNFCDVGWKVDQASGRIVIVACLDNLVKGAAGQAVQNFNVALEFDEAEGLR